MLLRVLVVCWRLHFEIELEYPLTLVLLSKKPEQL